MTCSIVISTYRYKPPPRRPQLREGSMHVHAMNVVYALLAFVLAADALVAIDAIARIPER